ncbi:complement C1q subcomponent subunit A-like [Dendronephthya gigantea]|uniref:complement C1q subcomponent subunit A-like n=1 Tax=Dendronephthya gigantea TaxID=151771 RepID=UPI00106BA4FE|nr:complement C1q subcomponent subunit A-like [Dendronephthya gigantea]
MGDTVHDGIHDDLTCEITKLSAAKSEKNTVVEYRPSNRRASLKIGLFVSIGLNVIFAALFVVVFIMLNNVNSKLSRVDELLSRDKVKSSEVYGRNDGQNVQVTTTPLDSGYRGTARQQEPSIETPTQVLRKNPTRTTTATNVDVCKCRGPQGLRGEKGTKGRRGQEGAKGASGQKGSKGDTGNTGPAGKLGPKGAPGPQGLVGDPGIQGQKGEPGKCEACNMTSLFRTVKKERPVAHLTAFSELKGMPQYELLDVWAKKGRYTQASPGMTTTDSEPRFINVTETGNYFIYSQVYFQLPATGSNLKKKLTSDDLRYMIHFVFKQSGSTQSLLLRAVNSNGFEGKHSGFFTSFTSGVHRLRKGDSLYVAVQKKLGNLINTNDDSTFFGAFKL